MRTRRVFWFLLFVFPYVAVGRGEGGLIEGKVFFEDKLFDPASGGVYRGTALKPVRTAVVRIYDSNSGELLGEGITGADGSYQVVVQSAGSTDIRVSVSAMRQDGSLKVVDALGHVHVLEYVMKNVDPSSLVVVPDFVAPADDGGGVFNVFDCCITVWDFIASLTSSQMPPLTVKWDASASWGTYFSPSENVLYLAGAAVGGDADEYDDAVIMHEFGHYIAFNLAADDSPGGPHSLSETLDPRLAWSEGWATFFSCVVRGNPYYLDTYADGSVSILLDIDSLDAFPDGVYSDNEVAVSAVLWDVVDSGDASESFDLLSRPFADVWTVMEQYFTRPEHDHRRNLETFWDGWSWLGMGDVPALKAVFGARKIEYWEDYYENTESSGNPQELSEGVSVHRTLYPADDVDRFKFNIAADTLYVVETRNLHNGADTVMRLYDADGTLVAVSDDVEAGNQASRLEIMKATGGNYFLEVNAYDGADWITRYGSYDVVFYPQFADLPPVEHVEVRTVDGSLLCSWMYPPGDYDAVIVAFDTKAVPQLEYVKDDSGGAFSVTSGLILYHGRTETQTSVGVTSGYFALWTHKGGLVSPQVVESVGVESPDGGGGGCFIATAAAPRLVPAYRRVRDDFLSASSPSRAFVHTYYGVSPEAAALIGGRETLKGVVSVFLEEAVCR